MNRSIVFAAILISAAILVNGFFERRAHVTSTSPEMAAVVAAPNQVIAVLPFTGLSAADPNTSLVAGIRREIVTRLAAHHIKATSVEERPLVGLLLIGNVQSQDNVVRVNVQLVDAASGIPRWSETYDRRVDDVLAVESEVAESVAKSVADQKT